jgi:methylglutaconyl-CoA hydratase
MSTSAAVDQGHVELEIREDGVAVIEFSHPLSNSLPGKILNKLANTITEVGTNDDVKVIILKSSGERAFCAGASFDELISIDDLETGKKFFSGFANVINACRKCPKLIIGRVQGKAVGGGVGVASAVDYCFATRHAAVKLSELAVGIGPFVIGPAVERKIGVSAMSQLAINATEWRTADWAKSKGLYTDVFESAEEMDEEIEALAGRLSKSNPEAMRLLKNIFWEGTEHWDELLKERAAMSGKLVLSDFARDAINAFKKK